MIRVFDIAIGFLGLFFLLPLLMLIWLLIRIELKSPIFVQKRVGHHKRIFSLYKFRSMKMNTKSVGSHMVESSQVTKLGHYLRRLKLDELPQLFNVLMGDMSLVGPRPCLPNQNDVIAQREIRGVFDVRPGITGVSQLRKIDMSTPKELAISDAELINKITLPLYFSILLKTFLGKGSGDANTRNK